MNDKFDPRENDAVNQAECRPIRWYQRPFSRTVFAAILGSSITAGAFTLYLNTLSPPAAGGSNSGTSAASVANANTATSTAEIPSSESVPSPPVQTVSTNSADVSSTIENVFKTVEPSVVAVVNYTNASDFFSQQSQLQESGVGSGVLFQKDSKYAYIVTNNHVVDGAAKLEAVLYTGKHITASLVGADPYTDLAVIRIPIANVQHITPARFVDSSKIQVGQLAIAIGTPMGLDFAETVTSGIISGKQRLMPVEEPATQQTLDYQTVIQTDAAINPGNSGGPLLDQNGYVVGINSSKIAASSFEGMGFAIPSNEVKAVAQQILATGHVSHPALGIGAYSLSMVPEQYWPNVPVNYGVYVSQVTSGAAKASGLKAGDVIVSLNGQTVQDQADLRTVLFAVKPGSTVTVKAYRGSQLMTFKFAVTTLSATTSSAPLG